MPLLEQLRYGQVIKKIAEIRKLTKAGMKKIGEEMVLPRIIVIGNESSGKSSTLERIAGQPVLPCDTGICTRAPVVLELKYDPTVIDAQIYFRGFTGEYEQVQDAEQARSKVQEAMDSQRCRRRERQGGPRQNSEPGRSHARPRRPAGHRLGAQQHAG
jgi:hypothetical protein